MAKNPAVREIKGEPLSRGVDARALLTGALNKRDMSSVTSDDVRELAIKKGFTGSQVDKIVKGFNQLGDNSLELDKSGKQFNVFTNKGGASASSRKTGNKKGFDAGDLIGLGKNVNHFGGFAASLIADNDKKKELADKVGKVDTGLEKFKPGQLNMPDKVSGPKSKFASPSKSQGAGGYSKAKTGFIPSPKAINAGTWGGGKSGNKGLSTVFSAPPQVDEVTLPPEVVASMKAAMSQKNNQQRQREYSDYLKSKYSNTFNYLTDNNYKLNDVNKSLLSSDFEKISRTQPNLFKYLQQFHGDKLKGVEFKTGGKLQPGGKIWIDDMLENPELYQGAGGTKSMMPARVDAPFEVNANTLSNFNRNVTTPKSKSGLGAMFSGEDMDAVDVAQGVGKYILPFIGEARGRKELDKVGNVKFTPTELMKGVERDMPRNYRPMYFTPEGRGSSLIETTASQKFGDAYNRDKEFQWALANAMQKEQTRRGIVDNTNRERMMNAQGRLQTDMFNNQMRGAIQGMKYQSKVEPWIAAQQHAAKDVSERAYYQSTRDANLAEMLVKNPEVFKAQFGEDGYKKMLLDLGYSNNIRKR